MTYYNENNPHAAVWLSRLMHANLILHGHIDTRSIADVTPGDLSGYDQCHFFAGIGGWARALQLAGWPANRPAWTGSCPCQPFSAAGKQRGTADVRHLWPDFARLIGECRPPTVFGEQVASRLGREWLSGVFSDLETLGYAAAGADLCAAGVGAPHIRQRLWWVANNNRAGRESGISPTQGVGHRDSTESAGAVCGLADCDAVRSPEHEHGPRQRATQPEDHPSDSDGACGLGHAIVQGLEERQCEPSDVRFLLAPAERAGLPTGPWDDCAIIECLDGKLRRIPAPSPESEVLRVADGLPAGLGDGGQADPCYPLTKIRKGRRRLLKGIGNAIVPQVGAVFVRAFMKTL